MSKATLVVRKVVKWTLISFGALGIVSFLFGYVYGMGRTSVTLEASQLDPSGVSVSDDLYPPDIYELWRRVNDERYKAGLQPLDLSLYLEASATDKCNDMVKRDYWSHNAPDGSAPWVFVKKYYPDYRTAGENLAYGFNDAAGVVDGWMKSEGHKKNILSANFTEVGFSYCESDNFIKEGRQIVVVQHFASP